MQSLAQILNQRILNIFEKQDLENSEEHVDRYKNLISKK